MSAKHCVLLIPSEEWREKLIGDGPCGSSAPKAWRVPGYSPEGGEWRPGTRLNFPAEGIALVLAWDAEPVPDGLFRVARLMTGTIGVHEFCAFTTLGWAWWPGIDPVCPYGRIVFLDADHREIEP